MLSVDAMQQLREAYLPFTPTTETEVLQQLNYPSRDAIIETAVSGMSSPDRNHRVLMLRVLAGLSGEAAMQGILMGLGDEARRVRSVAIKSCTNYLSFPQITERLQAIVTDEDEKHKIRGQALSVLAGHDMTRKTVLTDAMVDSLKQLRQTETYRQEILYNLLRLDLSEQVETLLLDFAENGSKVERLMATRALNGYRVVHIDEFSDDPTTRQYVAQNCEIAHGRVFYWITRNKYNELKELIPA